MAEEKEKTAVQTADQGCTVDWSWLEGRTIASVTSDLQNLIITFEDGLTFKVQSLNYKGQPFLAFNPYQNPDLKD